MHQYEPAADREPGTTISSTEPPPGLSLHAAWEILTTGGGVPVFVLAADGRVLFMNAIARVAFQISQAPHGAGDQLDLLLTPEAGATVRQELWKATTLHKSCSFSTTVRSRFFEMTLTPLPSTPTDPIGGAVGIARCPLAAAAQGSSTESLLYAALSRREREVLTMIGKGLSTESMAGRLGVTSKTIHNYVAGVARKLRVSGRLEMARVANQLGL